jgi:hypothetical protein
MLLRAVADDFVYDDPVDGRWKAFEWSAGLLLALDPHGGSRGPHDH